MLFQLYLMLQIGVEKLLLLKIKVFEGIIGSNFVRQLGELRRVLISVSGALLAFLRAIAIINIRVETVISDVRFLILSCFC